MSKGRILIVEDEVIIAMEIEHNLRNLGYEVSSVVGSSAEAIEKAEEDKPDLVIMDIRIQGDNDGIETAEIIRNRFGIPIVFSTAYLDEERIERAKITKPFGYLLKPIQERELRVTIEMALYVAKVDADSRKAQEAIKAKALFLDRVMEQSPFSMWISDPSGTVIKTNRVLRETLNLKDEQIIGKYNVLKDANLIEQGVMPQVKAVYMQHEAAQFVIPWFSEKAGDVDFKGANNIWIKVSIFPIVDSDGSLINVVCQWLDITHLKRAEEGLARNEKKYRVLFENSPVGVFLVDDNAKYLEANEAACKMTGYSKVEIERMSIPELAAPENQDIKLFLEIKSADKGEGIIHLKHKDGHLFKAWLKGVRIDDNAIMGLCEKLE